MYKFMTGFSVLALSAMLHAEEAKTEESPNIQVVSEAFGHIIAQNLKTMGLNFDLDKVIVGIENFKAEKASPLEEGDCIRAISLLQEKAYKKQAEDNLVKAESFLETNKKQPGIVEIEKGKLQYKQLHEGKGEAVEEHATPLVRYTGKFLDGQVFGESMEEESLALDETLKGFSQAIVGMKEGERREVYIHPELGYGTCGYLSPNSLLIFEVEVVKAKAPAEPEDDTTVKLDTEKMSELAEKTDPINEGLR